MSYRRQQKSLWLQACMLLSLLCLQQCSAIYFVLEEGEMRCFLEEVPKDTLVLGKYRAEDATQPTPVQFMNQQPNPSQVGVTLTVTDADGVVVLTRDMQPQGRFAFTSQSAGEHKICFNTNTTKWFGTRQKVKFHLDMETGEQAIDYDELAKQEHLGALEIKIRRLTDRIRDIRSEQNYQRGREATFRDTSESTNTRVVWWSILQTAILVGAGLWQISHLKHFFKTKKLV